MSKVSSNCVKTIVYVKENPVKFNEIVISCVNRLIEQLNDLYNVLINQKSLGVRRVVDQIRCISSTIENNMEILKRYIDMQGCMNALDKKACELIHRRISEFMEYANDNIKNEIDNFHIYKEEEQRMESREETIRNSHYNYNTQHNNNTQYNNNNTNYNYSNRRSRSHTKTKYVSSTEKYKCLESDFCSKIKERGLKRLNKLIKEDNITIT